MVLGGNDVKGCQVNGTIPTPATAMDAFDCFVNVSKTFEELGLKVAFAHGSFTSTGDSLSDLIMVRQPRWPRPASHPTNSPLFSTSRDPLLLLREGKPAWVA